MASGPATARVDMALTTHQRLQDVASMKEALGYPVLAFRFQNKEMTGEYSPLSGIDVNTYLAEFEALYGTQPEISHVVVGMPAEQAKNLYLEDDLSVAPPAGAAARMSSYEAPPSDPDRIGALFESHRERAGVDTATAEQPQARSAPRPTCCAPTTVDARITRASTSTVLFDQYLYWHPGEAATEVMHTEDGWEAEINIYTAASAYQGGSRPNCAVDYKARPFAQNYGWNWSVLYDAGFGMTTPNAPINAYADYNDLFDTCERNSIAIGIRNPQFLGAWPNGMQEMLIMVTAPRGVDNTGRVSGTIQPVNSMGCALQPWLSNTDCMGLTSSGYSARPTLGYTRGWTAPSLCWNSGGYGDGNMVNKYTC
ncbi:hypothetical protein [Microbacterium arborescens]|uniref:hypothetical protein n=1 Tax=Microbacterium arborescens TaxID=33883 RepID=UPI00277E0142|nr:hypothetical protein [Microbacterium arborescens]MDQ1218144.1 hypothetical protein [Microbacterium arborescens]